jgi:signal transduction histidine kinase
MPADELGQIFDVFHQIDRAKMEQQGSGSGLAIVQSIAAMHGGTVTATSVPGEGSRFVLEVPRAEG